MYTKDGQNTSSSTATCTSGTPARTNWVSGHEQFAKGWIECFHAYMGLGPPETHWDIEKFQKYSEDDLMSDVFDKGHVDVAIFQPTYLKEWYTDGFNTTERNGALAEKHPGKFVVNTRFDPRDGTAGLEELEAQRRALAPEGRQALHRGVEGRLARLEAVRPRGLHATWPRRRSWASRTSTCTRARRSGRWTRTRSTWPTSTTPPPTSPS